MLTVVDFLHVDVALRRADTMLFPSPYRRMVLLVEVDQDQVGDAALQPAMDVDAELLATVIDQIRQVAVGLDILSRKPEAVYRRTVDTVVFADGQFKTD